MLTGGAELDDLAPLGDGVVPVRLLGRRLHGDGVLGARAQEPVAPHRHGQGHRFGHQLGGDVLPRDRGGGGGRSDFNFIYARESIQFKCFYLSLMGGGGGGGDTMSTIHVGL